MGRIFVSSTYADLVAEREAVRLALLRLDHHPVAMEDFGATEERPLEKCLADVRGSDALEDSASKRRSIRAWQGP